jgi:hypothetical protein
MAKSERSCHDHFLLHLEIECKHVSQCCLRWWATCRKALVKMMLFVHTPRRVHNIEPRGFNIYFIISRISILDNLELSVYVFSENSFSPDSRD